MYKVSAVGAVNVGGETSITVMLKEQVPVLPELSLATNWTIVTPTGKRLSGAWVASRSPRGPVWHNCPWPWVSNSGHVLHNQVIPKERRCR